MAVAAVNTATADNYGAAATTIAAPATSLTAGNLIVVFIRSNSGTVSTVTDTAGNTYIAMPAGRFVTGHGGTNLDVYYAKNVTGNGSNVVTCTFSGSVSGRGICTVQYSGASTTVPFNGAAAGNYAGGTTVTSYPYTTNVADGVVILFTDEDNGSGSWTTPSGFTKRVATSADILVVFDKITAAVQTAVETTLTYSTSSDKSVIEGSFTANAPAAASGGSWAYA